MGFFSDAAKWASEQYGKINGAVDNGLEKVGDGLQAIGNYAIDGVEAMFHGGVDFIQNNAANFRGFTQATNGFATNVVTGTLNGASQGIEASVGENVVSTVMETIATGLQNAHDTLVDKQNEVSDKIDEFIDNRQEDRHEFVENIKGFVNEKIDTTQADSKTWKESVIEKVQAGIENAGVATDQNIEAVGDMAASVGGTVTNAVKAGVDKVATGIDAAGQTLENTAARVAADANLVNDAMSQTMLGEGVNAVVDYLRQQGQKVVDTLSDVFKDDNGQETDASIKDGVEKVTEAVASVGQSAEVGLKNGLSIIFEAIQGEAEIYSSDNLSEALASSKDGKLDKKDLENVVDVIKEAQGLVVDTLKDLGDNAKDTITNIENTLEDLFKGNQGKDR